MWRSVFVAVALRTISDYADLIAVPDLANSLHNQAAPSTVFEPLRRGERSACNCRRPVEKKYFSSA